MPVGEVFPHHFRVVLNFWGMSFWISACASCANRVRVLTLAQTVWRFTRRSICRHCFCGLTWGLATSLPPCLCCSAPTFFVCRDLPVKRTLRDPTPTDTGAYSAHVQAGSRRDVPNRPVRLVREPSMSELPYVFLSSHAVTVPRSVPVVSGFRVLCQGVFVLAASAYSLPTTYLLVTYECLVGTFSQSNQQLNTLK